MHLYLCVCMSEFQCELKCTHTYHGVYVEVRGQLSGVSVTLWGSEIELKMVRLVGKHLQLLTNLAGP